MDQKEFENEKPHRLEDITRKLYSTDPDALPKHRQGVLHQVSHAASTVWQDDTTQKVVTTVKDVSADSSFFKKFFIGSVIFFILAAGVGAYLFFSGNSAVSSDNVEINILGNAYTPGGEELPLQIEIINRNAVALDFSDLIIEYGRNNPGLDSPTDIARIKKSVGTVEPGKVKNEEVALTLYGNEGSIKDVRFTLQYRVAGSNAVFQKEKIYQVNINTSPVAVVINAPQTTTANQPYTFTVSVTPNVKRVIPGMLLKIEYPTGFRFQSGEPAPAHLESLWQLGDLNPGETKQIKVTGILQAENGEERSFRAYVGSEDARDKNALGTTFASVLHTVDIVRPFLEANLALNGKKDTEVVVQSGSTVNATVTWGNNLPVRIIDADIRVKLIGDLVNKSSVQVQNGFYNSADNTITWNKNTFATLGVVDPGEGGVLGFTFSTLSLFQQNQLITNPQIALEVSIKGKQPQEGTASAAVDGFERKVIKFATNFQITGQAFYHSGPFTNTGPLPPQVETKTTYTIKWAITNSANDVSNVVVRGSLPPYVRFLNVKSPATAALDIDPVTGDIVWRVGTVLKGTGFGNTPQTVYFQVELMPSLSQIEEIPILVNSLSATGTDSLTNTSISATWREINTRLLNDTNYRPNDEKVVQKTL